MKRIEETLHSLWTVLKNSTATLNASRKRKNKLITVKAFNDLFTLQIISKRSRQELRTGTARDVDVQGLCSIKLTSTFTIKTLE